MARERSTAIYEGLFLALLSLVFVSNAQIFSRDSNWGISLPSLFRPGSSYRIERTNKDELPTWARSLVNEQAALRKEVNDLSTRVRQLENAILNGPSEESSQTDSTQNDQQSPETANQIGHPSNSNGTEQEQGE